MNSSRMKPTDLFGVSVVDDARSQVICPDSLRSEFFAYLQSERISCSLGRGAVTIGNATYEVDVIITAAGATRVFSLLHDYMRS